MKTELIENRYEALDAIGHALKRGRISFAEASKLRDLVRSGRLAEVKEHLSQPETIRR